MGILNSLAVALYQDRQCGRPLERLLLLILTLSYGIYSCQQDLTMHFGSP